MKKNIMFCLLLCAIICGCKKNEEFKTGNVNTLVRDSLTNQAVDYLPLKVVTIAGKRGSGVSFDFPNGIDVAADGSIYIAEQSANQIRKISTNNVVSVVNIPNNSAGQNLHLPSRIRVQKDGTLNILGNNTPHVVGSFSMWIVKPNGEVLTPQFAPDGPSGRSYIYQDLQIDKRNDEVFVSGVNRIVDRGCIQRFRVSPQGYLGTNEYTIPKDSIYDDPNTIEQPNVTAFFCGYNGVKYIVMDYKYIYKLTPSGVFTRIFRNLTFSYVRCLVANKDSRSIYIVDGQAIKVISNNKVHYITGPSQPFDAHDGIGTSADVRAVQIALSNDDGTLYFTDTRALVRKILLR